jgi:hypothetical protein
MARGRSRSHGHRRRGGALGATDEFLEIIKKEGVSTTTDGVKPAWGKLSPGEKSDIIKNNPDLSNSAKEVIEQLIAQDEAAAPAAAPAAAEAEAEAEDIPKSDESDSDEEQGPKPAGGRHRRTRRHHRHRKTMRLPRGVHVKARTLKRILKQKGLPVSGKKATLRARARKAHLIGGRV